MNDLTSQQLLRDYAERRSEAAFAELARRHVDLVYSAALRMVHDAHLAEDVTQGVFVAVAQNAGQLADHPVLSGWLHRTARNLAVKVVRSDVHRRAREQEAAAMNELLNTEPNAVWEQIGPLLDDALGELNDADRDALLLRYFEKKSAREMAEVLGISDDAAQKRVSRAVERMRELFVKRGVSAGASALAVAISTQAVQSAPASLATTVLTTAIPAGATVAIASTATNAIAMTTLQKTLVATALIAAIGTGTYQAIHASRLRDQLQTVQQQQAEQFATFDRHRMEASNRLAVLSEENARLRSGSNQSELLKLRGEVGTLQRQSAADQAQGKSPGEVMAGLMNDSTSVELSRVQIRRTLKNHYAPLAQQLNLTPETTDKLLTLITDNEIRKKEALARLLSGDLDAGTALQDRDNSRTETENQIRALLGETGYAQFDQFNHDAAAGELVAGLNRELGENALNGEQSKRIQALFAAKPDILMDDMDLFRSREALDDLFQQLVDRGHHDLQEAASFLTPEQLASAYRIQSNYFGTIRKQMTLGQDLVYKTAKQSKR